jgi:histone H3/H4
MSDNDDDLCIPRSAMYKLVKELVPQVRLSGEAKDLIVTACNEFIHLLASESNNVCEKQSKKLILPDHVLLALDNLGFSEYKDDCVEVMKQMQEENHSTLIVVTHDPNVAKLGNRLIQLKDGEIISQ